VPQPDNQFDHHAADFASQSEATYRHLRTHCPVARTPRHGGYTVLSRHADIADALRQWRLFTSRPDEDTGNGGVLIPRTHGVQQLPVELDPPSHTEVRRLLAPHFTRQAIELRRPAVERLADQALSELPERAEADLVDGYARRVPAETIRHIIGLDAVGWREHARPITRMISAPPDDLEPADHGNSGDVATYIADEIGRCRTALGDGLLACLVRAADAGAGISDDDIAYVGTLLLVAGVENVCATIAHALMWLDSHHHVRQMLRQEPSLLPAFREEFLRYLSPTHAVARTAARDVDIAGVHVAAGERVLLPLVAANHDPAVFDQPDEVRLDRKLSYHLAFGFGIHHCLGAHLARMEIDVMLHRVLARYPDFSVNQERSKRFASVGLINGFESLYGTLGPRTEQ
jgi:cytochrome P450